jgi:hypothetical protein
VTDQQTNAFNERLEKAIDAAQQALRPLFDTVDGCSVYQLPLAQQELMHEIMFKVAMLRIVFVHGDETAERVHSRWLGVRSVRRLACSSFGDDGAGDELATGACAGQSEGRF